MTILYIAYSCSPYHGSEDKIGWNIPVESAKTNDVIVITREDQRQYVERYLRENPIKNIRFFYVDIPRILKKVLSKTPYTLILNVFHKYAYRIAKEICAKENIEIIHQITPIEFRSIGDYGGIPNTKYVCGPLGAGQNIPKHLLPYMGKNVVVEYLRIMANYWSLFLLKLSRITSRCHYLLFVNKEARDFMRSVVNNTQNMLCFDNGISAEELRLISDRPEDMPKNGGKRIFLVAGRLVRIKGHNLLFDALERIPPELEYEVRMLGGGPEFENLKNRLESSPIGGRGILKGPVPFEQMGEEYSQADVFIFSSLRESSGAVLLESMAHGVPVITINRFGGAAILDEETGWLYDGNTKEEFIENLKNAIVSCIEKPEEVRRRGLNARQRAEEYTWEERMKQYQKIYDSLVNEG